MARCRYYKMCWVRLGYDRYEWNPDCLRGGDSKCRYYEEMPRETRIVIDEAQGGRDERENRQPQ